MNSTKQSLVISHWVNWNQPACDEALIHAAQAGSHTAFAELQKVYANRLYKCILPITRNREDAEDALQDTLIRAYRGLPSFKGRSRLLSWLTRIAINSALIIVRKRRSRAEISFEQSLGLEEDEASFDVLDDAMNPEQLYDQRQRCERIQRTIRRLNPKLRTAILIRISKETSMREIGNELNVSESAAKTRVHRARKQLKQSPSLSNPRTQLSLSRNSSKRIYTS